MKITGGQARGLHIETPPGQRTRPTTDRVRESLFAILRELIPGARVLDLFAGSGALGLEAASRGAAAVTWIENHPPTADLIRRNLARLSPAGVSVDGTVVPRDVTLWLPAAPPASADLIFADPPYDLLADASALHTFLRTLEQAAVLDENGILLLELRARGTPELPPDWSLLRRETYGGTAVLFLDYRAPRT
jgi:16S rRNA (guanine966-N2)-methyltransferase